MTSVTLTINELLVIILAIAGMNWCIITLALAPLKQSIKRLEDKKIMTVPMCDERMDICRQLREAKEAAHATGKKHN